MKIIFIRHAEPDYSIDSLTEKGFREAELLANRTKNWNITEAFLSPLGRAVRTSEPTLKGRDIPVTTYDWLKEFYFPVSGEGRIDNSSLPWDFFPDYLNDHPDLFDANKWYDTPVMRSGNIEAEYKKVCDGIDELLAKHGYIREGLYYKTNHSTSSSAYMKYDGTTIKCMESLTEDEPVLVFFCHLGVMLTIISHLINCSPVTLWQGVFTPPASVTILSAEERIPGMAYFRAQVIGDNSHLVNQGEPVSFYGGFAPPFQY